MKTKLTSLFTGLALLAGVYPALAQPAFNIATTNQQVILFWTNSNGTNGVLQSATNLATPNWISATDAVPVNYGSQPAVSVANSLSARFFRLSLVPPATDGMALIPAGSFTMGDTLDGLSDALPMNIYVSGFYMDQYDVTEALWAQVYNWATNNGYSFYDPGSVYDGNTKGPNYPVLDVDWYDCVKWCNARSQLAGLTPVYYADAGLTQVYKTGETDNVYVNWAANGYRLPTEAEWEKAARGGLSGQRFPWGNTINESQANYEAAPLALAPQYGYSYDVNSYIGYNVNFSTGNYSYPSPVGSFAANGYGLYDMAGNVEEWCWDWYGTPYGQPTTNNPTGAGPASGNRVLRGGTFSYFANVARCAYRGRNVPIDGVFGFRCVRGL